MKKITIIRNFSPLVIGRLLFVCFGLALALYAEEQHSYFEQKTSIMAIEAENAIGNGWSYYLSNDASEGQAILFPQTDTLYFPVSEDTYIDLYNQTINYGASPQLIVDGKGGIMRGFFTPAYWNGAFEAFVKATFLKFYVTGLYNNIIEARIYLYCETGGMGGGIYDLDPKMDDLNWSEMTATWNNRPSKDIDANTFQSYFGYLESGNWYSFDVTESLFGKSNGSYSYGIVTQNNYYTAWSSREGANPPYLMLRVRTSGYYISGDVLYYSNNNPIPNVLLQLSGGKQDNKTSQEFGQYVFSNLNLQLDYLITASKAENQDVGFLSVTTYDAALTAQAAVGIIALTENQRIAADVSLDGNVFTYDAALIAQHAVGLPKPPTSHVTEWVFRPDTTFYESLYVSMESQNYWGIILGNVHGGWSYPGLSAQKVVFDKYDLLPDISTDVGEEIVIPIEVQRDQNMVSSDIDFRYDPEVLDFQNVKKTSLTMDFKMVINDEPGRIRIGIYGIKPVKPPGTILFLQFTTNETKKKISNLSLKKFQINNNVFLKGEAEVKIGAQSKVPQNFKLSQNYPNPFFLQGNQQYNNHYTVINYEIPHQTNVQLNVFNYLGQKVKTFVDSDVAPGFHSINWNGRDDNGEILSSGIYFYCLKTTDKIIVKRMALFK